MEYIVTSDVLLDTSVIETVEQGTDAEIESFSDRQTFLYTNQIDFDIFYNQLMGGATIPPAVDFNLYRVIATVDIQRNTSGYSVEITSVCALSGLDYTVKVSYIIPRGIYDLPPDKNKPYHIVKILIQ